MTILHKTEIADITLSYTDIDGNPANVENFTAVLTPPEIGELIIDNVGGAKVVFHFSPTLDGNCSIETHADGEVGEGTIDIPLIIDFEVSEHAVGVTQDIVIRPKPSKR